MKNCKTNLPDKFDTNKTNHFVVLSFFSVNSSGQFEAITTEKHSELVVSKRKSIFFRLNTTFGKDCSNVFGEVVRNTEF